MNRYLSGLLSGCILMASCAKEVNTPDPQGKISSSEAMEKLPVKPNFAWNTMKSGIIRLNMPSSVYAVNGSERVLLAENLPVGTYNFTLPMSGAVLEAEELTAPLSMTARAVTSAHSAIYFPEQNAGRWAMLLAEDVFPYLGDLDMNDIILNFRIKYEIDASRPVAQTESPYVKAIEFSMQPVAYGGNIYDIAGVALNLAGTPASSVINVNGQVLKNTMFSSESEAVIPVTDDLLSLFDGQGVMNTYNNLPQVETHGVTVRAELQEVRLGDVQMLANGGKMLDLFVTLGERGREVHLKGHPATSRLNDNLKEYASYADKQANWVWALIIPAQIKYSKEGAPVYETYPLFKDWVKGSIENIDEWTYAADHDNIYMPL